MVTKRPSFKSAVLGEKVWVYALMILAGIALGMIKYNAYQTAYVFSKDGVEVLGNITHMTDHTGSKRKSFSISYTFATATDPYQNGEQMVSEAFYDAQTDGGQIGVVYLPSYPSQSVVDLGKLSGGFGLTMLAALGLILGGAAGGYLAFQRARKASL